MTYNARITWFVLISPPVNNWLTEPAPMCSAIVRGIRFTQMLSSVVAEPRPVFGKSPVGITRSLDSLGLPTRRWLSVFRAELLFPQHWPTYGKIPAWHQCLLVAMMYFHVPRVSWQQNQLVKRCQPLKPAHHLYVDLPTSTELLRNGYS